MPTATAADRRPVVLVDTSVALALVTADHDLHRLAIEAVRGRQLGLAGYAWFETYSVLTRLPPPRRRSPADVVAVLVRNFPKSSFLTDLEAAALGPELARLGISGGAVYDALVGSAARDRQFGLLTADARARNVYEALGVKVEILAPQPAPAEVRR